jgi:hypothetical protein
VILPRSNRKEKREYDEDREQAKRFWQKFE